MRLSARTALRAVVLSAAGGVTALQAAPGLEGKVVENYGGVFRQSGTGPFVGVIQGPAPAGPDLVQLRAVVPKDRPARSVCFRATTFDGAYTADASLRAPANAHGPLAIDDKGFSQHVASIKRYASKELAVSFVLSADCDALPETPPTLLPATFGGSLNAIRVALNTRALVPPVVKLTTSDGVEYQATCQPLSPRAKAFLHVCDLNIDARRAGGIARLRVVRKVSGNAPGRSDEVQLYLMGAN